MPVRLYRTSCDQRKTTRQIWTHVSEFGVLRIQRTKLLFHKLAKLIIHARFLTTFQQRFRKLDVFLRLNQLLICWDTVFLKRVYSSLILGSPLHSTLPYHSPLPSTPMGKRQQNPCPIGQLLSLWPRLPWGPAPTVTESRVTLTFPCQSFFEL